MTPAIPREIWPRQQAHTGNPLLEWQAGRSLEQAGSDLAGDVEALADKVRELLWLIHIHLRSPHKQLDHGDYFLGNVLFDQNLRVSAVLDFGAHALIGDPRLDVSGAVAFLALDPSILPWHVEHVGALAAERYGRDMRPITALYTLYYSLYYANTKTSDPLTYRWCVQNLMDARLWHSAHNWLPSI